MSADYVQIGQWTLRFARGERAARVAAGDWPGATIAERAQQRAEATPDAVACLEDGTPLTFAAAYADATALARALAALGIATGETISFMLPNWREAVVIDLACALGGYVLNPIIPIYRQTELRAILPDCRARVIFVPDQFRGVDYGALIRSVRDAAPDLAHLVTVRGTGAVTYESLLRKGRALTTPLPGSDPDAAKLIIYTSGTTGLPKGVIYSHNQSFVSTRMSFEAWGLKPGTTILMPSPVTHVTGLFYGIEAPFWSGSSTVFMDRWDAAAAVDLIDKHGVELMVGATPFLSELLRASQAVGSALTSLKVFACGGAAVPADLVRRAQQTFAKAEVFRVYGSSETPMITQGCPGDPENAAVTDGRVHGWEVVVLGAEGEALPAGSEGEIAARGPALYRGYTNQAATRAHFTPDGFFLTGDLGVVTGAGHVVITGRKKDLIIRGGENLAAKEIEDALYRHPAIREVAVVAMPHPRLGEGVAACIVPAGRARPDVTELGQFLAAEGLARQKWPERLEYLDALPMTASGKVQKHLLRAMFRDVQQMAVAIPSDR